MKAATNFIDIESPLDKKITVKPISWTMIHIHAYQGPCRYGKGYTLTSEYDEEVEKKALARFTQLIDENIDKTRFNVLEPVALNWNEDFVIRDDVWDAVLKDYGNTDIFLINGVRLPQRFITELAKRTDKPILVMPTEKSLAKCGHVDTSAYLYALGYKNIYPCMDIHDVAGTMNALHLKEALRNTRVLFPQKGPSPSYGCLSSYISLDRITERLGVSFSCIQAEEVFEAIDALTPAERKMAEELTEELIEQSEGLHMEKTYMPRDYWFYLAIRKMLQEYGCNAFTIPCFEICATRELDKRKFTFCLAKTLLREERIPSACAGDVGSVISNLIMMAIAGAAPYMGNTMVWKGDENLCRIHHDSPTRFMKGYDKPRMPYQIAPFTLDDWGTTIRYNFDADKGASVTLINISPDMTKLAIVSGTVDGCDDFVTAECKLAMRFKVKDIRDFFNCQKYVGSHFSMVYGDWKHELLKAAEVLGMEAVCV